ncbi:MAG TPA: hypothetical protein VFK02_01090 [Kofleriaceae bacterium]|nr:hypothetical protein [Kofleriaceae bacterium]
MSQRTLSLSVSLLLVVVLAVATGCGGSTPQTSDEPSTARDKQRQDAEARGDGDRPAGKRSGWRYSGERNDCFFVVGHTCFKSEAAACAAARCGKHPCVAEGGGPAQVSCEK